ncbi:alpha/beta hydrolase-fold protein [Mucilaginibacter ginsenosidivorax]|uniref:Tetratricopeptide repeat protein n=1 Tax=Mucilaginibacter ginsenosidivorax TaxID=862126 RepID=A0A5B8W9P3_9SPHI|nr:alpha/beta hydrolase-fold protein [Mucilaginibacter ginsenosidivorax]QEC79622.1 tetratricopeptide repeat protein [Mucilaginibacter ginsenosidivorax]
MTHRNWLTRHFRNNNIIYILLLLLTPKGLFAQTDPVFKPIAPDIIKLSSKVLDEDRKIYIYVPPADTLMPGKRYPVLYVLDGDNHFSMLAEYCRYLSRWDVNVTPEMIIVGIPNTNRTRDLTPTHSVVDYYGKPDTSSKSWLKPSGGGNNFLKFISSELIPYVDAHYKTEPFRIFAGHSFGGITTINCLLTQPDTFGAYIAISPSFWWDKEYLLNLADKKLKTNPVINKMIFYSDANEGGSDKSTFHVNLLKFDSLITQSKITGLDHKYVYYPEEIHMTEPVKGYYDALRFIYKQWDLPDMDPKLLNASVVKQHYQQLSARYGYAIIPTELNISNTAMYLMTQPGALDNAISLFEINAENYPASSTAFSQLGDAYLKKGNRSKAITYYKKALALNPGLQSIKAKLTSASEKR